MIMSQYTIICEIKCKLNHYLNSVQVSGDNKEYFNIKLVKIELQLLAHHR